MRRFYSLFIALLTICGLTKAQVVFDFTGETAYEQFGLAGFSSTDSHDGDILEDASATSGDVTITVTPFEKGNPNRMWTGSLRLYGGTLKIASSGKNITAIDFTLNSNKWGANTVEVGTLETGKWTGDAASVVITIGGNTQIKSITVTFDGGDTPQPTYKEYTAIAPMKADVTSSRVDVVFKAKDLLVTFVSGNSLYLYDGTDGLRVYGANSGIKAGDKITADIKGQLYLYNGLTEIAVSAYENLTVNSSGNAVEPQKVTVADVISNPKEYESELVQIEGLYAQAEALASRNVIFMDDSDNEIVVRDNFNVLTGATFDTEAEYTVTGFVNIYDKDGATTMQLYPRTAEDVSNGETPQPYELQGDGTFENPYTITDVLHLYSSSEAPAEAVWVKGCIIGACKSTMNNIVKEQGEDLQPGNIVLADAADETSVAKMIPVQLPAGKVRDALNLVDNFGNLGKNVYVYGTIEKYFTVAGVKGITEYSLDGIHIASNNSLDANAPTIVTNQGATMSIGLTNEDIMIAFEFDLQLPDGISMAKDENDDPIATLGSRASQHSLVVWDQGNGLYHFLCYSNTNKIITGNEGELLSIALYCDESTIMGTHQAMIKNIIFSDVDKNKITMADYKFNIEIIEAEPGDVNKDGDINVMDVVEMVAYIMGQPSEYFVYSAADLDPDGVINVMDLVNLVEIIMNTSSSPVKTWTDDGMWLHAEEDGTIAVSVNNAEKYVASEFMVEVSAGQQLADVRTDERHKVTMTQLDETHYKVMNYSRDNCAFKDEQSFMQLHVTGEGLVTVQDALLVDKYRQGVAFAPTAGGYTTGIKRLATRQHGEDNVYDLQGRKLSVSKGRHEVFIVNGKKMISR